MGLPQASSKVDAATGATIYSDPLIKQAVQRLKAGQMSPSTFTALYSGQVKAKHQEATSKHAPKHGFGLKPADHFVETLKQ